MSSYTPPGGRSTARQAAVLLAAVLVLATVGVGLAGAHAYISTPTPDEGEQVEELPAELELEFTGDSVQVAEVAVEGPDGDRVDGDATLEDDSTVTVPVEDDGDGIYLVEWEVLSEDGHTTSGTYFFVVGDEEFDREEVLALHEDTDDEEDTGAPPGESAAKGLLLLGVIGLLGVPLTLATVVSPATRRFGVASDVGRRRARNFVAGCVAVAVAGVSLLGLVRVAALGGGPLESIGTFVGTPVGRVWAVQLLLSVATVTAVWQGMRRDDPRQWLGGSLAGGLALAFTVAWTSHSATLVDRVRGLWVDLGHVFGAAVWVGGLLVLGVVLPPYLRAAEDESSSLVAARATALFSVLALFGVGLVVVTGLLLTAWHVPSLEALWTTTYGALLSAKVALVFLALGLGGINRVVLLRWLRPAEWQSPIPGLDRFERTRADGGRPDRSETVEHFVRSVRIEVAVLVVVILLTGALTSAPTAAMVADGSEDGQLSTDVDGVELVFEPTPSELRDGQLVVPEGEPVVFDVSFTDDGDPVSADDDVGVVLDHDQEDAQLEFELGEVEEGLYSEIQAVPSGGEWTLRVDAFVDGTYVSEEFDVRVGDGHDHDDDHDHDGTGADDEHDDGETADDHEQEEGAVYPGGATTFTVAAQLGAVAFGILGSVAVVGEARRSSFPRRVREGAAVEQFAVGETRPSPIDRWPALAAVWAPFGRAGTRLRSSLQPAVDGTKRGFRLAASDLGAALDGRGTAVRSAVASVTGVLAGIAGRTGSVFEDTPDDGSDPEEPPDDGSDSKELPFEEWVTLDDLEGSGPEPGTDEE